MLALEYAFQNMSLQKHCLVPLGTLSLSPVPLSQLQRQDLATQHPDPLASNCLSKLMIQNNLAFVYPQNIHKGIKWSFVWSRCHAAEEASVLLIPKPGAGHENPVVAGRMLQQSQPSEMSFQPWLLLDLVEGELLQSPDPTEHQLISHQGQGLVLSC